MWRGGTGMPASWSAVTADLEAQDLGVRRGRVLGAVQVRPQAGQLDVAGRPRASRGHGRDLLGRQATAAHAGLDAEVDALTGGVAGASGTADGRQVGSGHHRQLHAGATASAAAAAGTG